MISYTPQETLFLCQLSHLASQSRERRRQETEILFSVSLTDPGSAGSTWISSVMSPLALPHPHLTIDITHYNITFNHDSSLFWGSQQRTTELWFSWCVRKYLMNILLFISFIWWRGKGILAIHWCMNRWDKVLVTNAIVMCSDWSQSTVWTLHTN